MNIELKEITVRQLTNGYQDNEEGGAATAATTNQPKGRDDENEKIEQIETKIEKGDCLEILKNTQIIF